MHSERQYRFRGITACNDPNESVLVEGPPDPGGVGGDDDDGDENGEEDEASDDDEDGKAVLPSAGASDHLNLIGGAGIALSLAGLTIVAATARRRGAAPPA